MLQYFSHDGIVYSGKIWDYMVAELVTIASRNLARYTWNLCDNKFGKYARKVGFFFFYWTCLKLYPVPTAILYSLYRSVRRWVYANDIYLLSWSVHSVYYETMADFLIICVGFFYAQRNGDIFKSSIAIN